MTSAAAPRAGMRRDASRRRARWVEASAWFVALTAAALGTAAFLLLHRGDPEGSARLANRELEWLLAGGERVEQRVPVMQRHWWDWYRVTHGVLAATNRRLLYVGIPPEPVLPLGQEPLALQLVLHPYERPAQVAYGRTFLGTRPALRLLTGSGNATFAFAAVDRSRVDGVVAVLTSRQAALRSAAEAERRAAEATVAASRRAIYHLVQRGEAIDAIARRYGVPAESLITWNALPSTRITAGRRLLVKPGVP
jgi:LysM domain